MKVFALIILMTSIVGCSSLITRKDLSCCKKACEGQEFSLEKKDGVAHCTCK